MDWLRAAEAVGSGGGSDASGGYWQLVMILAGIGFLGLFARWRKLRTPPQPSSKTFRERELDPNRYRDAADRAIVELLETSRSLNAQVDTKIRVLNTLIKEAEILIAELKKLLAEARGEIAEPTGKKADSGRRSPASSWRTQRSPGGRTELQEQLLLLRKEGKSMTEIARATSLSITEVEFALQNMGAAEEPYD
ncbi:MAG: hypothetical protein FWG74_04230 [Planctomycetes bacterium]|nr:hypothetical protein [Planctomycetota bacterium]